MKLSFRLLALSEVLLLVPLARHLLPFLALNRLRNLGNSGRFGSPLRTVLQYPLCLNLTGECE